MNFWDRIREITGFNDEGDSKPDNSKKKAKPTETKTNHNDSDPYDMWKGNEGDSTAASSDAQAPANSGNENRLICYTSHAQSFEDRVEIAKRICKGQFVIVNITKITDATVRKDLKLFLDGVAFAMGAKPDVIEKEVIFCYIPRNKIMDISDGVPQSYRVPSGTSFGSSSFSGSSFNGSNF